MLCDLMPSDDMYPTSLSLIYTQYYCNRYLSDLFSRFDSDWLFHLSSSISNAVAMKLELWSWSNETAFYTKLKPANAKRWLLSMCPHDASLNKTRQLQRIKQPLQFEEIIIDGTRAIRLLRQYYVILVFIAYIYATFEPIELNIAYSFPVSISGQFKWICQIQLQSILSHFNG